MRNKEWGDLAKAVVKGDLKNMNCYYTNSIHFDNSAKMSYFERLTKQSNMHPLVKGGCIVHMFVGENLPPKETIRNLVEKVYNKTQCAQMVINPEFVVCEDCNTTSVKNSKICPRCGSEKTYNIARIVGYYSVVQNWSKNKQEERESRNYKLPLI